MGRWQGEREEGTDLAAPLSDASIIDNALEFTPSGNGLVAKDQRMSKSR
jgi:hypothetical protein